MSFSKSYVQAIDCKYDDAYPDSQADSASLISSLNTEFDKIAGFTTDTESLHLLRRDKDGTVLDSVARLYYVVQDAETDLFSGGTGNNGEFYDHASDYVTAIQNAVDVSTKGYCMGHARRNDGSE